MLELRRGASLLQCREIVTACSVVGAASLSYVILGTCLPHEVSEMR